MTRLPQARPTPTAGSVGLPSGLAAGVRTLGVVVLLLLGGVALRPSRAPAQEPDPVELRVDLDDGRLQMSIGGLLREEGFRGALHSGLPVRIRVVAELWRDGFFDSQAGREEWRATVTFDPLERRYRVETVVDGRTVGWDVSSLESARVRLQRAFEVSLRPPGEGTYYYLATVEVETLSLSDLEELRRWLGGELGPAVRGEGDVEGAVGRGVSRLMVRILGLPARSLRLKTPSFDIRPRESGSGPGEPPPREPPPGAPR